MKHKDLENAKEITIKMTKSDDGIFYPKDIYAYLDGEAADFIKGIMLNAHIDDGVEVIFTYMLTDKSGSPERDENGFIYRHWRQELPKKETLIEEDDIELIEEDEDK